MEYKMYSCTKYECNRQKGCKKIKKRIQQISKMEETNMSKNKIVVPEAQKAMENFKMEAANEVGVNLKQGYNGDLTSKQAGSIGGQMVKKMIEDYENKIK